MMSNLKVRKVVVVGQNGGVNLQEHVTTTDKSLDNSQEFFLIGRVVQLSPGEPT